MRSRMMLLVVMASLGVASCRGGESTETSLDEVISTAAAVIPTSNPTNADGPPVPADDAKIEIVYTGEGTSYNGDRQIIEGTAMFTFLNESDHGAVAGFFWYQPDSTALAEEMGFLKEGERGIPVGLPAEAYVEIELDEPLQLEASDDLIEPGSHTWTQELEAGTYIFDVGPEDFHVTGLWRAVVIDVAPEE